MKIKNLLLGAILLIVFVAGCSNGNIDGASSSSTVKEFNTQISGFKYDPETINVNLGDSVKINIKNNDRVTHGISLPVFGVSSFVGPGQTTVIQFVADQTGNPETFCSTDHGEKLLIQVN